MKAPKISDVLKAKDSSQISLDDIRSQVTELACGDERFKSTEGGEMSQCLSKPWCDGVLYKEGEFSAVVYCAGCKLWEVGLTIEKGAVTELGDEVKEVKRKTSYITATEPFKFNGKAVEDSEGEIVKCGAPAGNKNAAGKRANDMAPNHPERWQNHHYAYDIDEAGKYKPGRSKFQYVASRSEVIHHDLSPEAAEKIAREHNQKLEIETAKAKDANVGIPTQEENVHESFFCKDAGIPLATEKPWKFGEPVRFMWAPGNTSYITCGCCDPKGRDRAVHVFITADNSSAKSVQNDFESAIATTPRRPPIICIEHHEEEAAVQLFDEKKNFKAKFEWDIKPEPGIYCTGSPTKLGEGNVNGKLHTSFSPSFRHDAKVATAKCEDCEKHSGDCECGGTLYFPEGLRGSEKNPAKIVGIGRKSGGSLTNWPAFKDILPLTAKEPDEIVKAAGNSEGVKKSWDVRKRELMGHAGQAFQHRISTEAVKNTDPAKAKEYAGKATDSAESASKAVSESSEKSDRHFAHNIAANAHSEASRANDAIGNWQASSHHSTQREIHSRYANAANDESHADHDRAMKFKASEPAKNKFEGVKIISSSPKSIYDGIVVNGQPAGRK